MFIISLTYKVDLSIVDTYIDEHILYLEKYYARGKFITSGRKVPRNGGIILVNAADLEEVDTMVMQDPFYIADVASHDVTEFVPTMAAKGFETMTNYH